MKTIFPAVVTVSAWLLSAAPVSAQRPDVSGSAPTAPITFALLHPEKQAKPAKSGDQAKPADPAKATDPAKPSDPDAAAAAAPKGTVNLNTATLAQLETLPGIGRKTAERILEHRQKSGGFKKIEELMNVKGIGEKSFLKIKPMVVVTTKPDKAGGGH